MAFRYVGASGLYSTSPLQRLLRDLLAASQHIFVVDSHFETFGRQLVERAPIRLEENESMDQRVFGQKDVPHVASEDGSQRVCFLIDRGNCGSERTTAGLYWLAPGREGSPDVHPSSDEIYYVVEGRGSSAARRRLLRGRAGTGDLRTRRRPSHITQHR